MRTSGKRQPSPFERVNSGDEDEMIIEGYIPSVARTLLFWLLVVLSCGFLLIVVAWKPGIKVRATHCRSPLDGAQTVVLKDLYKQQYVETVVRPDYRANSPGDCIHFYHKKIKYLWRPELSHFVKIKGLESEKCATIYSLAEGLNTAEAAVRLNLFGTNSILIEVKPIWKLIIDEVVSPFYLYQMFIVMVWMVQLYYQFSLCIFFFSVVSVSLQVWETRKQSLLLREKVHSESEVCVLRDGDLVTKSSKDLVPGDVVLLSPGVSFFMECDALLITGNCTVDESMLTGESVPISKVALTEDPKYLYSPVTHKNSTLFCGTEVLYVQATDDAHVKAIVLRTGFSTAKGELVRTILFPKAVNYRLKYDYVKCMVFFFILGIPCMTYTAITFNRLNAAVTDIIIIVLDVATFLVPPLLPAVMTSINAHAQRRLREKGIYCLNSSFINFGGGLDVVCFDKTGTLTDDSINFAGIVPVAGGLFKKAQRTIQSWSDDHLHLLLTMATCHSLVEFKGRVDGDTLDLKMFEAIKWEFKGENFVNDDNAFERLPDRIVGPKEVTGPHQICGIIRQFPFESLLQRMLVIVKQSHAEGYLVLLKGAPEMVVSFCDPASLPFNWQQILESYTRDGLRVLATASKVINSELNTLMKISREKLEESLQFDGFIVFQNCLKPETAPTLASLKEVDIRNVMITGDNLLTAISVARNSGMIEESDSVIQVEAEARGAGHEPQRLVVSYRYAKMPGISEKLNMQRNGDFDEAIVPMVAEGEGDYHFCMDGKSFEVIRTMDPSLLEKVVRKGTIFARMSPDAKLLLVEELQRQEHQVGMCGDGANDCGALRIANAGISLSIAESSVASPFTYKEKNIKCIPILIKEGRATLAATFGAFKYQVTYCFVLLAAVMTLFWDGQKPSDGGYVFIDIILNLLPPLIFGTTHAFPTLSKRRPQRSLFAWFPLFSIFSFVLIQVTIYLMTRDYLVHQPWYEPFTFNETRTHRSEASHMQLTIISVNTMSYVISAVIFAPGPPYRKGFFSNKLYLFVVFINFMLVVVVTLYPAPDFLLKFVNFKDVPFGDFKLLLFTVSITNFVLSYLWEVIVLQGLVNKHVLPRIRQFRGSIHRFEKIDAEMKASGDWPPIIGKPLRLQKSHSSEEFIGRQSWGHDIGLEATDNIDDYNSTPRTLTTFGPRKKQTFDSSTNDSFL